MTPAPPPSPAVYEATHSRRIRPHEFARLEPQLHHHMVEDQGRAMDPFQHPLDEEDPLNHSLSDLASEDTFYSIELSASHNLGHGYGDLPPLGAAATESTSSGTPPRSLKTREFPMPTRLGSTPSSVPPVSHLGHGSQQSVLGDEVRPLSVASSLSGQVSCFLPCMQEDSVAYSVTVNVLTVSRLPEKVISCSSDCLF